MPIAVLCTTCDAHLKVGESHAGKRGKCPKCGSVLMIPALVPAGAGEVSAQAAKDRSAAKPQAEVNGKPHAMPVTKESALPQRNRADALTTELLAAFQGNIQPVRPSILYLLSVALVSGAIVLLPLLYVALVLGVGIATGLHAVYSTKLFASMNIRIAIFLYLAPLFAGVVLLCFMLKPLFARPVRFERSRSLTRFAEPRLFAFIERLCAAVGAPMPTRVDIDSNVNASASLRRGMFSLFSDDLVLTIGVPLVGCLSVREFAGVLAHEFGHFSQRGAMRLGYLVHKVNGWFVRIVSEKDSWDVALMNMADDSPLSVQLACGLATLCVTITRGILMLFMITSVTLSRMLLRQQEFHADLHEIRLAGSESFTSTMKRLHLIGEAEQAVMADLVARMPTGRLPDSFPRLLQHLTEHLPQKVINRVMNRIESGKTSLLDTHPPAKERIARAERAAAPGIFVIDQPATVLLNDYAATARNVTLDVYRGIFGAYFDRECLVDSDLLLRSEPAEV